jgi:hypothetical protein
VDREVGARRDDGSGDRCTVKRAGGGIDMPGTGLAGAKNMIADATMLTVPMAVDAAQGNAGMKTAVSNTACPN